MNRHEISRLQTILSKRLDRLVLELFPGTRPQMRGAGPAAFLSGPSIKRVDEEWTRLLAEIGISRGSGLMEICLFDPAPRGDWLLMTRETALKILTLGMP